MATFSSKAIGEILHSGLVDMDMSGLEARVAASPIAAHALSKLDRLGAMYGAGPKFFNETAEGKIRGNAADFYVLDDRYDEMSDEDYRWWRALKQFLPQWQHDIDKRRAATDPYHHVKQRVRKAARSHGRHHRKAVAAMAWMVADRLSEPTLEFQGTTTGRMSGKTQHMMQMQAQMMQQQIVIAQSLQNLAKSDDLVDALTHGAAYTIGKTP